MMDTCIYVHMQPQPSPALLDTHTSQTYQALGVDHAWPQHGLSYMTQSVVLVELTG